MPTTTDRINGLNTALAFKAACRVGTTAAITLSGLQTIDGVALAADDRVLVMDQADAIDNGIYKASTTTWERTADFDGTRDVANGTLVVVMFGTLNARKMFVVDSTGTISVGTSEINFSAFEPTATLIGYDTFTGDGSDTTFTLSHAPGNIANIISVTVNGTALTPGVDYSVSGTTLTFVVAPGLGWEILVRYLYGFTISTAYALAGPLADSGITGAATSGANTNITSLDAITMTDALEFAPWVDLASAATCDIGAVDSNLVRITGSTGPITSFGTAAAGVIRFIRFASTPQVNHDATSLILQTGANITAQANDSVWALSLGGGNWFLSAWARADGSALSVASGSSNGEYRSMQVFTASGTYTKPSGLVRAEVLVVAAGGAGGAGSGTGGGSGGGGGGASLRLIAAGSIGATETVTVGVGDNGAGDSSSFGTLATATGGGVGGNGAAAAGAGGTGSSGTINMTGQSGGRGSLAGYGGAGGDPAGGHGHGAQANADIDGGAGVNGAAGVLYGGGGAGGSYATTGGSGGNGASGIVIVREYF